jgi:hypothetical protein
MQFKFKTLAAAALLAAASLPSFAVINTTATNTSLVLYAFDISGSGATYYRDLGSVNTVLNATGNVSFAAPVSSIFSTTFAAVAATDITWGIFGLNSASALSTEYIASGRTAVAANQLDHNNLIGGATGTFGTFVALDLATNGYIRPNGEYTGNAGADNFASNAIDAAGRFTLGTYDLGSGIGSSLNLFRSVATGAAATVTQINTNASGQAFLGGAAGGYFTLADAAGNLTWTQAASVAAVPVPAAALMFGPALLAMVGIGRRNKKSA